MSLRLALMLFRKAFLAQAVAVACMKGLLGNSRFPSQPIWSHAAGAWLSKRRDPRPLLIGSLLQCSLSPGTQHRHLHNRGIPDSMSGALGSSRIELLVDADSSSIEVIRSAIRSLEEDGRREVSTTLFIPPKRIGSKTWAKFIEEPGINFEAVCRRSIEQAKEPTDEAIVQAMHELSSLSDAPALALLTGDTGFLGTIVELKDLGSSITVLVEENKFGTISIYEGAGVEVVRLQLASGRASKVRAILHPNGSGSVKLSAEFQPPSFDDFIAQENTVVKLMKDLGYRRQDGYLGHQCAKFWFTNELGSLTVYPHMASILAVHDHVTQCGRRSWEHNGNPLAFFLPTTSIGVRGRRLDLETYGNVQSRAIFRGGGPFMLPDSPNLTAEALRRLGFLDDGLNGNLAEAMFVFANISENKNTLRRQGLLPDPEDKSLDVERKLRSAFLSTASPGKWRRNETVVPQQVLQTLQTADKLPQKGASKYSHEEIFEAMKSFVSRQKLPRMHTFNGLRFRIVRYIGRKDPTMRKEVDFRR